MIDPRAIELAKKAGYIPPEGTWHQTAFDCQFWFHLHAMLRQSPDYNSGYLFHTFTETIFFSQRACNGRYIQEFWDHFLHEDNILPEPKEEETIKQLTQRAHGRLKKHFIKDDYENYLVPLEFYQVEHIYRRTLITSLPWHLDRQFIECKFRDDLLKAWSAEFAKVDDLCILHR